MIYVSTGGCRTQSAVGFSRELLLAGVKCVELSGGLFSENQFVELQSLSADAKFQIHNYFPPPANPFVLNLGSLDELIGQKSVEHVELALQWCQKLGADRYSFHAGFLLDPRVDQLGKRIPHQHLFNRQESIEVFVHRVTRLARIAEQAGVRLMIENNVLSAKNAKEFSTNPLLMSDPQESQAIMKLMPDNLGLLIDVAHLKVSANSLGFEPALMFDLCRERITGYHLSDNNGLEDSNQPFTEDAWFWRHLDFDVDYHTVEVYGCTPDQLLQQTQLVRSKQRA